MIDAIKSLENALAYAKFEDDAIKARALDVLKELDTELTGELYDVGTAVEAASIALDEAIEATDSDKEEKKGHVADAQDVEDPFAGLGEEEEG
jgi:hypothetical protein